MTLSYFIILLTNFIHVYAIAIQNYFFHILLTYIEGYYNRGKWPRGGGGGATQSGKGIDCGPTAGEWWLSRHALAKKGGCPYIVL